MATKSAFSIMNVNHTWSNYWHHPTQDYDCFFHTLIHQLAIEINNPILRDNRFSNLFFLSLLVEFCAK